LSDADFLRLVEIARSSLNKVGPDTVLDVNSVLPELGLDSFGTVRMIMGIEEEFDILLPDEALTLDTFRTLGAVWQLVSSLRN